MDAILDHFELLKLIKLIRESFEDSVLVYSNGSCVRFCLILSHVYPSGKILYDSNHAIFELHGRYYDITGEVEKGLHIDIFQYGYNHVQELFNLKYNKS